MRRLKETNNSFFIKDRGWELQVMTNSELVCFILWRGKGEIERNLLTSTAFCNKHFGFADTSEQVSWWIDTLQKTSKRWLEFERNKILITEEKLSLTIDGLSVGSVRYDMYDNFRGELAVRLARLMEEVDENPMPACEDQYVVVLQGGHVTNDSSEARRIHSRRIDAIYKLDDQHLKEIWRKR